MKFCFEIWQVASRINESCFHCSYSKQKEEIGGESYQAKLEKGIADVADLSKGVLLCW